MIKCIAIDDEPLALQQLTNYLKKVPFFEIAGSCLSASEAMKILSEEPVDAIFLDINMPDLNGLEFVQSLVHQPLIVFTTAYSEYALEATRRMPLTIYSNPTAWPTYRGRPTKSRSAMTCSRRQNWRKRQRLPPRVPTPRPTTLISCF